MKIENLTKLFAVRMGFAFIAFGFTLISAWNGFNFYRVLFGLSMAILISATFEIARFTCLFKYMHSGSRLGFLTITLYIVTASVCAFASINSFTAEVIRQNRVNEKEFHEQIYRIKQAYLKKMAGKFATYNKDISYLENMVAKYPERNYWKRRLSQVVTGRDEFVTERDRFLNVNPEKPEQWIRVQSAHVGLKIEKTTDKSEEIISVKMALRELWGLKEITAQKIMGIIVTLVVEISILILAILATRGKNAHSSLKKIINKKKLMIKANTIFGQKLVNRFLTYSRKYFVANGKLPPLSKLNRELRPVRLFFESFDPESLKEPF